MKIKKIRKMISLLLALTVTFGLLALTPATTAGATSVYDSLQLTATSNGYILSGCDTSGWTTPQCLDLSNINSTLDRPLIGVGNNAFSDCTLLSEIYVPSSVTSVGDYAFANCVNLFAAGFTSLTTVGSHAFYNCSNLSVSCVSETVTSIGDYAFYGCTFCERLHIPHGCTIGAYAFANNPFLSDVFFGSGVNAIPDYAFQYCSGLLTVTIPLSLQSVAATAFDGVPTGTDGLLFCIVSGNLAAVDFAAGKGFRYETISDPEVGYTVEVLYGSCARITGYTGNSPVVEVPSVIDNYMITEIGYYAFSNHAEIEQLILPDDITAIGDNAFYGCSSLRDVILPAQLHGIGDYAFSNCSALERVVFPHTNPSLTEQSFSNVGYGYGNPVAFCTTGYDRYIQEYAASHGFRYEMIADPAHPYAYEIVNGCAAILRYQGEGSTAYVPDTLEGYPVTYIGCDAFAFHTELTFIQLPTTVTEIMPRAFANCTSLNSVLMPFELRYLGAEAFLNCSQLLNLDLYENLMTIDNYVLSGCRDLNILAIPSTVTYIAPYAFVNCQARVVAPAHSYGVDYYNHYVEMYLPQPPYSTGNGYGYGYGYDNIRRPIEIAYHRYDCPEFDWSPYDLPDDGTPVSTKRLWELNGSPISITMYCSDYTGYRQQNNLYTETPYFYMPAYVDPQYGSYPYGPTSYTDVSQIVNDYFTVPLPYNLPNDEYTTVQGTISLYTLHSGFDSVGTATLQVTYYAPDYGYRTEYRYLNVPQLIHGDADSDGTLTINDATVVQMVLAEYDSTPDAPLPNLRDCHGFGLSDANNDGVVNINDVTTIQLLLANEAA